uniref:Uncharacterized protein n=1 Tax=Arundo donax TaxID=35708 RepID=A0A0A9ANG2_ARUDO
MTRSCGSRRTGRC